MWRETDNLSGLNPVLGVMTMPNQSNHLQQYQQRRAVEAGAAMMCPSRVSVDVVGREMYDFFGARALPPAAALTTRCQERLNKLLRRHYARDSDPIK